MNAHDMNAIAALDLEPIKVKLMHRQSGEGWSLEHANAMEQEYRRFLYLMKTFPHEDAAPLVDVDTFWHYHILDTMKYAADCEAVFGYFLHHFPYIGLRGGEDLQAHEQLGARMQQLYEQTFGEPYLKAAPVAFSAAVGQQATEQTAFSAVVSQQAAARTAFSAAVGKTAFSAAVGKTAFSAAVGKTAFSAAVSKTAFSAAVSKQAGTGGTAFSAAVNKTAFSAAAGKTAFSAAVGKTAFSAAVGKTAFSAAVGVVAGQQAPEASAVAADQAIEQARRSSFYTTRPRLSQAE